MICFSTVNDRLKGRLTGSVVPEKSSCSFSSVTPIFLGVRLYTFSTFFCETYVIFFHLTTGYWGVSGGTVKKWGGINGISGYRGEEGRLLIIAEEDVKML